MITLFQDQAEVVADLRSAMKRARAILLQSPTGSGKTAMGVHMIESALQKLHLFPGKKIIFMVPRKDLLEQTSRTLRKHGIKHSFIASGKQYNPFADVYIGMAQTMARKIAGDPTTGKFIVKNLPKGFIVFVDETHFGSTDLGKVINYYKSIGAWVIGLSATPWKLNGQGLGIWYDEMVLGRSIRWLIDNKRLSDYRYFYGRTREDFKALAGKRESEISEVMEGKRVIIGDCVNDYRLRCMGRLHIVRCTSIKHSQMTAQAFRDSGIPAEHVDGDTPETERLRIFTAFARREIWVLTFAQLLNFGFDLSQITGMDVCIESGSDMKPSQSLAGQMQFWGRMLRYKDYPAIINDHVNNYLEHGLPCADRQWTLESLLTDEGGEGVPPTRQCPMCMFVHSPAPACPECGYEYEIQSRTVDEVDGTLHEIDIQAHRNNQVPGNDDEETLEYLIKQANQEGRKNPVAWAAKELARRINKE